MLAALSSSLCNVCKPVLLRSFGVRTIAGRRRKAEEEKMSKTISVKDVATPEELLIKDGEDFDSPIIMDTGFNVGQAMEAYEKYNYPYIEREWWKKGKRMTRWVNWKMCKDIRRREAVEAYGANRKRLITMMRNNVLPQAFRDGIAEELHNFPRDSCPLQIRKLCQTTAKWRGNVRRYRVSRIIFRDLADHGKLSGVVRAIWG